MDPVVGLGDFVLDARARRLQRGSQTVHLTPKALELLLLLAERRPAAVSREEIRDRLWPATFVSDANLAPLVFEVRAALGESAREPRFVRTVQGFGYALDVAAAAGTPPRPRLVHRGREHLLADGETVIGRGAEAGLRLDSPRVSRRHAVVRVEAGATWVADCGSRHGTLLNGRPLGAQTELRDGDRLEVGPEELVYRGVEAANAGDETA